MCRSWTLQEGVLGRECVYQFANVAICPLRTRRSSISTPESIEGSWVEESTNDNLSRTLYTALWGKLHETWKYEKPIFDWRPHPHLSWPNRASNHSRLEQLVLTWNELANRSTTMAEDIHVIIANLLDFDPATVMKLGTRGERMHTMLCSFKTLPFSLFYNTGPRSQEAQSQATHQNRWLPTEPSKSILT
jgi:hypothetical protein